MMTQAHLDPARRQDFVLLFDVTDGNPNGDPDAGNLPRVDPETMQGLVTDVAVKRKVRDYVDVIQGREGRFKIYVQGEGIALNAQHRRAYEALQIKSTGSKQKREEVDAVRAWMCANFYDIRCFGAVMTTGVNCGQVRGPLQLTFARSIDPIIPLDVSITRIAVTKEEDAQVVVTSDGGSDTTTGKSTEMGRKSLVPYGLYRAHGFFSPHLAQQTGFAAEDLALFWEALLNMWDLDHSAARGLMACRGLYVFSHDKPTGNAPAHKLFERIEVVRCPDIEAPRSFRDYSVTVVGSDLPAGVVLTNLAA
jgi:CRISPR-associated protein Csd2